MVAETDTTLDKEQDHMTDNINTNGLRTALLKMTEGLTEATNWLTAMEAGEAVPAITDTRGQTLQLLSSRLGNTGTNNRSYEQTIQTPNPQGEAVFDKFVKEFGDPLVMPDDLPASSDAARGSE
jgi:hypothetical protein